MNTDLTSLGVGGIIVIMVVKEMFVYLKSRKNGVASTDVNATVVNILNSQTAILSRLEKMQEDVHGDVKKLVWEDERRRGQPGV